MDLREKIEKLAYELYEKSGRMEGKAEEHWLEAERILKARAKEEIAAAVKQVKQAAKTVEREIKKTVKETAGAVKTGARKTAGRSRT